MFTLLSQGLRISRFAARETPHGLGNCGHVNFSGTSQPLFACLRFLQSDPVITRSINQRKQVRQCSSSRISKPSPNQNTQVLTTSHIKLFYQTLRSNNGTKCIPSYRYFCSNFKPPLRLIWYLKVYCVYCAVRRAGKPSCLAIHLRSRAAVTWLLTCKKQYSVLAVRMGGQLWHHWWTLWHWNKL